MILGRPVMVRRAVGALLGALLPLSGAAATLEVPISMDYAIVSEALARQVFTGPGQTAEVFDDGLDCNTAVLARPRVTGGDDGRLRLVTDLHATFGTPLGGNCGLARDWQGVVESEQTAHLQPGQTAVTFRIVDSRLLRSEGGREALPGFVQSLIREHVHPRLGGVRIDLAPALAGIEELLALALPSGAPDPAVPGLRRVTLHTVHPAPEGLVVTLAIEVPDAAPAERPESQQPLTESELAAWDANWQAWDAFATWMIKTLAGGAGPELTRALGETLLEARHELREALARNDRSRDPVRELFLATWARLSPLLRERELAVPGGEALRFAGFVGAMDALQALDAMAPHLGLVLDRNTLRSLARSLDPAVTDQALHYDGAVDPELRALLGLGPPLDAPEAEAPAERAARWLGEFLLPSAHAASIDPGIVRRLNRWVPQRPEIDNYLRTMARLLDAVAGEQSTLERVPADYRDIYAPLLRATAWQESCWRQYVDRGGVIEPIRSAAGSVGLMQVNTHVWRGVYDMDRVHHDVAYNARAGNEILVHYLVDYAVRKKVHEASGDLDDLVRATYAMYNGGPGHMRRFRDPATPAPLRRVDQAFWSKYQAIQEQGPGAVKRCLVG